MTAGTGDDDRQTVLRYYNFIMLQSGVLFVDTNRGEKMTRIIKGDAAKGSLYIGN